MTFWAYLVQCADRHFYAGHTEDLETRLGQHQAGLVEGHTRTRRPVHLVWCQEFPSRYEALQAERQIKGWSRAKKLALIRGDWPLIAALAESREEKGRASTGSARTEWGTTLPSVFLHPHQGSIPSAPFSIEVSAKVVPDRLRIQLTLTGPLDILRIPARAEPARRDELWRHTCFEAFVAFDDGYLEFNLSPSTEWAAYSFTNYRAGMSDLDISAPAIRFGRSDSYLHLTAEIEFPRDIMPTRLGLSAVIEEVSGAKSYWALRHPPGDKPDFHHPDCFALELPSASGA